MDRIDITELDLTQLYDLADECIALYHSEVQRYNTIGYNKGLLNSRANWVQESPTTIKLVFELPDYYVFPEEGRKPSKNRQDPKYVYEQILKWVRAKNITPKPRRRKYMLKNGAVKYGGMYTPTQEQLAWAIYNKIHQRGYYDPDSKGKHLLRNAVEMMKQEGLAQKAIDNIAKQYGDALHAQFLKLADYSKK